MEPDATGETTMTTAAATKTEATWMDYALALDCKGVRDERDAKGRVERCLAALGYIQTCGRCGGGGHYSRNSFGDTRCYDCTGRGTVLARVTKKIVAEAAKRVAAGELAEWRAANRANAEAKRAIAPVMATLDAEWKEGAVHADFSSRRNEWRVMGLDLYTWPPYLAAGLINKAHSRAHDAATPYGSKGRTAAERIATINECLAMVREINASYEEFLAEQRAAEIAATIMEF